MGRARVRQAQGQRLAREVGQCQLASIARGRKNDRDEAIGSARVAGHDCRHERSVRRHGVVEYAVDREGRISGDLRHDGPARARLPEERLVELRPPPAGQRLIGRARQALAVRALERDVQRDRIRTRIDQGEVAALGRVLLQAEDRRRRRRRRRRRVEEPERAARPRRRRAPADEDVA